MSLKNVSSRILYDTVYRLAIALKVSIEAIITDIDDNIPGSYDKFIEEAKRQNKLDEEFQKKRSDV